MTADQLLNFLQHARKNPSRGDAVFRCGFNGALDVVAARIREMQAANVSPGGELNAEIDDARGVTTPLKDQP